MSGRLRKIGSRAPSDLIRAQGSHHNTGASFLPRGLKGKRSTADFGDMSLPYGPHTCTAVSEVSSLAACLIRSLDCSLAEGQQDIGGNNTLDVVPRGVMDAPKQCSIAEVELPSFGKVSASTKCNTTTCKTTTCNTSRCNTAKCNTPKCNAPRCNTALQALESSSRQDGTGGFGEDSPLLNSSPVSSPSASPSPPLSPVSPLPPTVTALSPERAAAILRNIALAGSAKGGPRALTGLHNLGNTCFMNSCVQCLSHSAPLVLYFLKEAAALNNSTIKETGKASVGQLSGTEKWQNSCQDSFNFGSKVDFFRRRNSWDDVHVPRVGLAGGGRNLGEANGDIEAITESFLATGSSSETGLSGSFGQLIREMWSAKPMSVLSPCDLLKSVQNHVPQFAGYRQHDSQEFLRSFVDKLDEECNQAKAIPRSVVSTDIEKLSEVEQATACWDLHMMRNQSPIQEIFCGQLQSSIECRSCRRKSHCFDPFLDLSLPIPTLSGGKTVNIMDCISSFMTEEKLENENAYNCSNCKSPQPAVKKLCVSKFPPLLVLHVKRITSLGYHAFQKDSTFVQFDLEGLNLERFLSPAVNIDQRPIYDLYAVCNHTGSISSGHYTAYCQNVDNGLWYNYNDSKVSQCSPSSVCTSAAYVLFYQLRDV